MLRSVRIIYLFANLFRIAFVFFERAHMLFFSSGKKMKKCDFPLSRSELRRISVGTPRSSGELRRTPKVRAGKKKFEFFQNRYYTACEISFPRVASTFQHVPWKRRDIRSPKGFLAFSQFRTPFRPRRRSSKPLALFHCLTSLSLSSKWVGNTRADVETSARLLTCFFSKSDAISISQRTVSRKHPFIHVRILSYLYVLIFIQLIFYIISKIIFSLVLSFTIIVILLS